MKTNVIAALIVAAGLSSVAAQAADSYAGVNVGRTEQKFTVPFAGSLKESDTSAKLYTGLQFDKTFGVEAGFAHHGESSIAGSGLRLTAKPQSLYVAGTAALPIGQQFSLFGKVGVTRNRVKFSATGVPGGKESNTSALVGVGAAYAFTSTISGVVEYENYGKLVDQEGTTLKANMISVGIRSTF